jgi:hypothetical protein
MTKSEQSHLLNIKSLPCGVCGHPAPSDAHHITDSGRRIGHYATIPLCKSCHQDNHNGIHGRQAMWKIYKVNELDVLNKTIEKLVNK